MLMMGERRLSCSKTHAYNKGAHGGREMIGLLVNSYIQLTYQSNNWRWKLVRFYNFRF